MPRKRKNGHSPGRTAAQAGEGRAGSGDVLTSNSTGSPTEPPSSPCKEQIVRSMQEMFSHLDPVVIYIILSEVDFRVESAMDSLLELSDAAAKGKAMSSMPVSGFEMADPLLVPQSPQNQTDSSKMVLDGSTMESIDPRRTLESSEATHLTKEFDSLIDQELEVLSLHQNHPCSLPSSKPFSSVPIPSKSVSLPSVPSQNTLPAQHAVVSELEQLDMSYESNLGSLGRQRFDSSLFRLGAKGHRSASPVNKLGSGGTSCQQERDVSVDFSHLTKDFRPRPSAFKAYQRPNNIANHANVTHSEDLNTSARTWNIQAPEFQPQVCRPVFITPVMQAPKPWSVHPFTTAQWLACKPVSRPPLKPSAIVPKSWTHPSQSTLRLEGQVLVLLRGAPGSGKTTLASAMLEQNLSGIVLSTDEFFIRNGKYKYDADLLGEAHAWNHQRAKEAFGKGCTPIIIDNTNMKCWEMKPYVAMALKHKYRVLFREPDTWWKNKPRELEKRTKHGVTREKIRRMLENQDRFVSVHNVMVSQPKPTAVFGVDIEVPQTHQEEQSVPFDVSHPDLVGDSGFIKPGGHHYSSLPDVSTVSEKYSHNSQRMGAAEIEIGSLSSKESSKENIIERPGTPESELLDGADLDWELDSCIPNSGSTNNHINEELSVWNVRDEVQPVPFSESIGQRVRRARARSRFADDVEDCGPLNFEHSNETLKKANQKDGCEKNNSVTLKPELLNFVGDWPSESLEPRGQRSRKSATQSLKQPDEGTPNLEAVSSYKTLIEHSDCENLNKTEFQKLLGLLQGDEANKESPTFENTGLEAEKQIVLPDCVLDWKFGRPTDSEKDNSQPQTLTKGLIEDAVENQTDTLDTDAEIQTTTNSRTSVEAMELEAVDKPSLNANTPLSPGVKGNHNDEVSQDKRKGANRRTGKSCRLALTFSNQSPSSTHLESMSSVIPPLLPELTNSPQPEPLLTNFVCASVQSDPQDFALLWRINQKKRSMLEPDSSTRDTAILEGDPLRFVPNTSAGTASGQHRVTYHICHEKGSQVEESDLTELPLKEHSLEILHCHFKHIPLETLEDLYEKCDQDVDWVTNLLLDSGEELHSTCNDADIDDDLGPEVTEEKDLDPFPSKESHDTRMTLCVLDLKMKSKVENRSEQATNESSNVPILVPGTRDGYNSTVRADAGEPELGEVSKDSDQKHHLEHRLEEPDKERTAEKVKCLSLPSSVTLSYQSEKEPTTHPDNTQPNYTESQQTSLQELTSFSQREMTEQCFDGRQEGWIEKVVGQEEEAEYMETKENMDAIMQLFLGQLEVTESKKEEEKKGKEKERRAQKKNRPMDIKMLELKLPPELALQLTELFGPVGISPGEFSPEDCSVLMDLTFAKLLHQKWKGTIQERHRQAALSYHIQESSIHRDKSQFTTAGQKDSAVHFPIIADGDSALSSLSDVKGFPFMDHWNVFHPPISLRDIMIEEQVMQESLEKSRLSRWDVDKKDGAAILKENQLFTLFPSIDKHFLRDIFRDHNYCLEQTEHFLHTLLDHGPVRNVVAPEGALERNERHRSPSKERKRIQKHKEAEGAKFQDTEDPEYEDFRTEALIQRRRQQESFDKAAEAYRQGRKDVASFYAQQGHLHGQKMREANHRAAVQIFERVNSTLLPQNVLDLHGLHVDEALYHLQLVLADKTSEVQQGLCRPELSVITGRGNHSQGGVARVRPAVLDYLRSQNYRYSEPKPGLVLVTLH